MFVRSLTRAALFDQQLASNRDRQEADSDFCNLVLERMVSQNCNAMWRTIYRLLKKDGPPIVICQLSPA